MDLRIITPAYAVAPQIEAEDMATLAASGYTTVICNRPDDEVSPDLHAATLQDAAQAAGLAFVHNPVVNGALTMDMVTNQGAAIAQSTGPVFAYCRSGTRSTIVWALSQAGNTPTDELIQLAANAGYDIAGLRGQIDSLA